MYFPDLYWETYKFMLVPLFLQQTRDNQKHKRVFFEDDRGVFWQTSIHKFINSKKIISAKLSLQIAK
ncbi:hypothetical protein HUJ04_007951 [Dendroctonus ponderosae]|nr:hypothetical protein HUJ04_007951 [Dendroctonus ponderosae]